MLISDKVDFKGKKVEKKMTLHNDERVMSQRRQKYLIVHLLTEL